MSTARTVTIIGFSIIFFYAIIQIFNFYNIEIRVYSTYLFFYALLMLTIIILPNSYSSI